MNSVIKKTNDLVRRWDVILCVLMASLFYLIPEIDLWVAQQFHDGQRFYLQDNLIVRIIYWTFAKIHLLVLLAIIVGFVIYHKHNSHSAHVRKRLRYVLLVLLLAPGIFVNLALKDNSIGRARPVHLEQFGGDAQFTPAFVYSGYCNKNCSFTSGHAAVVFFFMVFGWLFRCHKTFIAGLTIGVIVSAVRIMQGGHFLSDVMMSFWIVYFTGLTCAYLYKFNFKAKPTPEAKPALA
ncbi:hypothetical protein C2869_10525 [Saccharobesus litoralis]|uniref:Phosphatidic acid phosphatase type 2/haloperoxidase domain-containing protein n=1 Tax=Saccharobesus litoralis TaxID=2172099 RepID=A0A2S0VRK0_9ALTE|nr:phosphatase PAP2 family protein [Saccharobesus litoralis]AWB66839.1 hypothetical protein C2869_10525 [Saccharobesus litoralis]